MSAAGRAEEPRLAAGAFSTWLHEAERAIAGQADAEVPCGTCTACCTSSQFVHIGPDETETLAHIPKALLFPAPLLPRGHLLLGYDERGHCPMLVEGLCSIYEHRPRTCRTYDCRVFPAAGLALEGDPAKAAIADRARQWDFDHLTDRDQVEHQAVQAAARFLDARRNELPESAVPANTTQLAALAIEIHGLFLERDPKTGEMTVTEPGTDAVAAELLRRPGPSPKRGRKPGPQARRRPRV